MYQFFYSRVLLVGMMMTMSVFNINKGGARRRLLGLAGAHIGQEDHGAP